MSDRAKIRLPDGSIIELNDEQHAQLQIERVRSFRAHGDQARIVEQTLKPIVHGTSNAHNTRKCKCDVCKDWNRKASQAKRDRDRRGQ